MIACSDYEFCVGPGHGQVLVWDKKTGVNGLARAWPGQDLVPDEKVVQALAWAGPGLVPEQKRPCECRPCPR